MAPFAACCRLFSRALTVCGGLAGPTSQSSDTHGSLAETDGGNRCQTHIHTLAVGPGLTPIPPPPLAPSGIWGLVGRLSPFLLDLQDIGLFFYVNMLL